MPLARTSFFHTITGLAGVSGWLLLPAPSVVHAQTLLEALTEGRPSADMRYRYEFVDQQGLTRNAHASTLRTRAGYETRTWHGFNLYGEIDNISDIGGERYNDAVEGRTRYPVVPDDATTELNQGYLNYQGVSQTNIRAGRQFIDLDNERFIGSGRFRQNAQTFDAVVVTNESLTDITVRYGWIANVNRPVGDDSAAGDFDSNSHFLNLSYTGLPWGRIVAYDYLVDLDDDAPGLSTNTVGGRLSADHRFRFNRDLAVGIDLEAAHQKNQGANPADISLGYFLAQPRLSYGGLNVSLGYEELEGDGTSAFQTPLAGLHAFNGVTDQFGTIPATGLRDVFLKVSYALPFAGLLSGTTVSAQLHDFHAEESDDHYGMEWSAKAARTIDLAALTGQPVRLIVELEYARYDADSFAADTDKFWASLTLRYN